MARQNNLFARLDSLSEKITLLMQSNPNFKVSEMSEIDEILNMYHQQPLFLIIGTANGDTVYGVRTREQLFDGGDIPAGMFVKPDRNKKFHVLRREYRDLHSLLKPGWF